MPNLDDKNYWREKLLTLQQDLIAQGKLQSDGRDTVELDQSKVGRLSRIDALQVQAMNNAVAVRRKNAGIKVKAALERLDEGEFGYCTVCGDDIVVERLEVDPATPQCLSCSR